MPLDCVGAVDGACRLLELLELEEPEPPDEPELSEEFEVPDEPELPEDWEPPEELPGDDVEGPDDPVEAEACVAPGSRSATTPAVATLARETAVVVAASRLRPRSRSATARATADGRVRNCRVLMAASVSRQLVGAVRPGSENTMSVVRFSLGERSAVSAAGMTLVAMAKRVPELPSWRA